MRYLGGKTKLAKKFAPILVEALGQRSGLFYEPFVGGFNLLPALGGAIQQAVCSDNHSGLITLYQSLQAGTFDPPKALDEVTYKRLQGARDWASPLTAFAAFGCSFGGKEFGGYARDSTGTNYADQARRGLLTKRVFMGEHVEFRCQDYRKAQPRGCVVYADPPYVDTTAYKTGSFEHSAFYEWCEAAARRGCLVFVSEFSAPSRPGWEVVWSVERHVMVRRKGDQTTAVDYLLKVAA